MFEQISSNFSGIHFNNTITDNDSFNVLDAENIYNGGGVGIADFNNDGLQDIYFTGNMVSNKLYLNKGDFRFEDITEQAGVAGEGRWCRGVSVVDINNDGLQDVYVCASLLNDKKKRENLFYINKGIDARGYPRFENMASVYGLADTVHSTMAAFFDYDNDGDLDMYLLVNEILKSEYPNKFRPILRNGEHPSTGKLFQNNWNDSLNHPVFRDVSKASGITIEGYGHGVTITDINKDGWKDIYVTNDFLPNNILYINNGNGTFTDKVQTYFKHTSANSMGQDVIDINNDGLADVIEVDMNPEDNYRKKMMLNPNSYQTYQNSDYFGYQYQYVRNTLQLNQGPRILENDSIGEPIFSDISYYSGIAETDWSWAPVVTDFDNDGFRDMIITNGFPKDVTDHDFIMFRNKAYSIAAKKDILEQIPAVKISNYAYKNNGDLTFKNVTQDWGMTTPSFSNGAAYADFDNDGDLDFVVNNINDEALLYKNNERQQNENHYLQIQFSGDSLNKHGIGAWVELHYNQGKQQVYENTPYRGYLSSVQNIAHFGLGSVPSLDSVIIKWPNGKMQLIRTVKSDQVLRVDINNAKEINSFIQTPVASNTLFRQITTVVGIQYIHEDKDFIDFNIQKLLPHKFSEYGPALAAGDVDGNGLDDIVSGGAFHYSAKIFLQQQDGRFVQRNLLGTTDTIKNSEDLGILLFDADGDKDQDLYIASGGYEAEANTVLYQDRFYINDGNGNYTKDTTGIPKNLVSKSCVRAADFDKDGDLDLFIAGRVEPSQYPKPVSSLVFRNDTKKGNIKFTDVTDSVAPDLINIGLICDAVFSDFDNDGWIDLVLLGEWTPVTFLKNNGGVFTNVTANSAINRQIGWWNTVAPGDFDNDGDIDYIAGNLGQNSFYRANDQYPVFITGKDFDNNGSYDAVPSLFLPETFENPYRKEFPAQTRDDMVKQIIGMRSKFQNYKTYATATIEEVFTEEQRKEALRLHANYLKSAYLRNNGNGNFTMIPLPFQAQLSVLCGIVVEDFDGDGNLDVIMNGNDFGTEVSVGRYDALNGLLMKGDGKGNFYAASILESGICIPGNGKALIKLRSNSGKCLLAASENRGALRIFELKNNINCMPLEPLDITALIKYKDGKAQRRELYYGSSFLSQSARFLNIDKNVASVDLTDSKGTSRNIIINKN